VTRIKRESSFITDSRSNLWLLRQQLAYRKVEAPAASAALDRFFNATRGRIGIRERTGHKGIKLLASRGALNPRMLARDKKNERLAS
jgi:hypothetical protein